MERSEQEITTTVCTGCGAETREAKFCPECGEPVPTQRPACAACGHRPERAPKFCPECGTEMPHAC